MAWGAAVGGVVVVAALVLTGQSSGVRLSDDATEQLSVAMRTASVTVRASGDDVTQLAQQAGTDESVVRAVATTLDDQEWWSRTVREVGGLRGRVPADIRVAMIGTACQALRGRITSEVELVVAVAEGVPADHSQQRMAVTSDVRVLWQLMYDVWDRGDEADRATMALACFAVRQLG